MENYKQFEHIAENYRRVRENMENALARRRVGHGPVRLLAATKTVPPEEILFAAEHLGLDLIGENRIDPSVMVTHIGSIDATVHTTLNLPHIAGGKKLIYNHIHLPLTAIADFPALGKQDARFAVLADLVASHNGLWCAEAEAYLLANF